MKTIITMTLVSIMSLAASTAFAQQRHYNRINHYAYHRPVVTRVIVRPAVTLPISNRLSKHDRLDMALAYLKSNKSLSIARYSKMTGLSKATAEAELNAFAVNKHTPIKMVINGKRKLYVIG